MIIDKLEYASRYYGLNSNLGYVLKYLVEHEKELKESPQVLPDLQKIFKENALPTILWSAAGNGSPMKSLQIFSIC